MAINFPDYPNPGDFYTVDQTTWTWDGDIWAIVPTSYAPNDLLPAQSGQAGKFLGTNGTTGAWTAIPPGGITLIGTTNFTAASTVSVNNVFSSTYKDYQIRISNLSVAYVGKIMIRWRVGGVDNTSSVYYQAQTFFGTTSTTNTITTQGLIFGNRYYYGFSGYPTFVGNSFATIVNPFEATETGWHGMSYNYNNYGGNDVSVFGGRFAAITSFTGFSIYHESGQPITGRLSVYGLAT